MKTYTLNYDHKNPIEITLNVDTIEQGDEICEQLM